MPTRLERLAEQARAAVTRAGQDTHASITLRRDGVLRQVASSDERAARCDEVEVREEEGPCVTAMDQMSGVLVPDLDDEDRWPAWNQAARDTGFRSAAALPAYVDEHTRVAVNLYSGLVDPWSAQRILLMDALVQEVAREIREHPTE